MAYKAQFDRKRKFGVEIELYGINQFELQHAMTESGIPAKIALVEKPSDQYWYITCDGSIQGEDPAELKSPVLVGIEGINHVRSVLTLLNHLDVQVNDSCGLHVHHYVGDFTGKNILSLLRLYAKFENVVDRLVDPSRRENKNYHCQSLIKDDTLEWITGLDKKETARALDIALKFDQNYKVKSLGSMTACGSRNHKVNITSYLKHSTIEFRHHESTLDIDEVLNWIVFTQQFISRAKLASVSKEMSAKPVMGEMLRALGMVEYQGCSDPVVLTAREWIKNKIGQTRRGRKPKEIARQMN